MQRSAQQLVTRALRLVRVIGQDEAPSASDSSVGLAGLVSLMAMWQASPQMTYGGECESTMPTFVDLPTAVDIPDELVPAIEYSLAEVLAPEFGAQIDAFTVSMAAKCRRIWGRNLAALMMGRMRLDTYWIGSGDARYGRGTAVE